MVKLLIVLAFILLSTFYTVMLFLKHTYVAYVYFV